MPGEMPVTIELRDVACGHGTRDRAARDSGCDSHRVLLSGVAGITIAAGAACGARNPERPLDGRSWRESDSESMTISSRLVNCPLRPTCAVDIDSAMGDNRTVFRDGSS